MAPSVHDVVLLLALIAGGLAIVSFFKPLFPLISVAVLLLSICFFLR